MTALARSPRRPSRRAARGAAAAALAWLLLFAGGCPWFTNMADQPSVQTFETEPRRSVPGTVPIGEAPFGVTFEAADALASPFPADAASVERGRTLYDTYCLVCHGPEGAGDGPVVPRFVRPPSLMGAARGFSDGYLYVLITNGRGNMPSYNRIPPDERWDVIHFLRQLQSRP